MNNILIKLFIKNHKHTNDRNVRHSYGNLANIFSIICNIFLLTLKLAISIITNSVSIGADAINNLSDATTNIISLIGFKLAKKPADAKHPYGHGRYEYIAALCVSIIMFIIGFELFKTGIDKIINPEFIYITPGLMIGLFISVLIKLWMMLFNRKCAKAIQSTVLYATSQDSRNDCITTIAIIIGVTISYYAKIHLDGWICIGVSLFIMYSAYKLIKETLDPLIGSVPDMEYIIKIKNVIMSYPRVLGMHDLIIHDYGTSRKFASVHVEMSGEDNVYENHDIIDEIETYFLKNEGLNIIIHYDPIVTNDPVYNKLKQKVEKCVNEINPLLSIHDFRIQNKSDKFTVLFDCVIPHELQYDKKELINIIKTKIYNEEENCECVISIDEYYPSCLNKDKNKGL